MDVNVTLYTIDHSRERLDLVINVGLRKKIIIIMSGKYVTVGGYRSVLYT